MKHDLSQLLLQLLIQADEASDACVIVVLEALTVQKNRFDLLLFGFNDATKSVELTLQQLTNIRFLRKGSIPLSINLAFVEPAQCGGFFLVTDSLFLHIESKSVLILYKPHDFELTLLTSFLDLTQTLLDLTLLLLEFVAQPTDLILVQSLHFLFVLLVSAS